MLELITSEEYATSRSLSLATIRRYCRTGILPHLRVGRAYKIDPQLADEALSEHMKEQVNGQQNSQPRERMRRKGKFDFTARLKELQGGIKK